LPPLAVRVSEHRLHGVCCRACAARTRAALPRGVPRSSFGPRLQAAVVTLAVRKPRLPPRHDRARAGAVRRRALDRRGRCDRPARQGGARWSAHAARTADPLSLGREHRRNRLENRRRQPDALARSEQRDRGLPDRGRPPRVGFVTSVARICRGILVAPRTVVPWVLWAPGGLLEESGTPPVPPSDAGSTDRRADHGRVRDSRTA
jgi:hypothetical protein